MNDADFQEAEEGLGFQLPLHYKSFMRAHGAKLDGIVHTSAGDLTMSAMLAEAAADAAVGEIPGWWNSFFAIGEDGGGGYYLLKRDGSPEVWLMDSDWHEEPQVHSPTIQAFVNKSRGDD